MTSSEASSPINAFIARLLDTDVKQTLFKRYGFATFTSDDVEDMYYDDAECIINVLKYILDPRIRRKWEEVIEYINAVECDDYNDE